MNFNSTTPSPSNAGHISIPHGWKAEWSAQYGRYFYVNLSTNESTWNLPATTPVYQTQQPIQRKPVPSPSSPSPLQNQAPAPVAQRAYIEGYPTPPPQVSGGYFPATTTPQHQKQPQYTQLPEVVQQPQPQQQNNQSPIAQQQHNPQQQYPQAIPQQQQQSPYAQSPVSGQPQFSPAISQQSPAPFQQQPRNYTPPSASPSGPFPQFAQQPVQTFSPPPTPGTPQSTSYALSPYHQQPQVYAQQNNQIPPQQRQQPPQQYFPQGPNSLPQQHQQQQYQQPQPQQYHQQQQPHYTTQPQPPKRSSMMPASLMSNPMMSKMTTKFSTLQKGTPPSAAHPNGKPPADWKKWGKRAAIGVAGVGALALGMDAAGDMFSGAEGLAGGGDFSGGGGDFSGGGFESGGGDYMGEGGGDAAAMMDAQTAVDANYTELSIAGMGQDNASMLADPVGTTYIFENAQQTQGAAGLI